MSHRLPAQALPLDLEQVMRRMPISLASLRNESLFITGGTGLFGRWLLESLAQANRLYQLNLKATVLTRDIQAFAAQAPHLVSNPMFTYHLGDVRSFDFPPERFSFFIHGATTSAKETFQGESPLRKFDTLVEGTRRVLDFAARCNPRRFLFLSSGVAYGVTPANMGFISEDYAGSPTTTDALSALGQAKRTAEFLCTLYAQQHQWEYVIARCFSFVGPLLPLDIHYAIGSFIREALFEDVLTVNGDGSPARSYLYLGDLVTWLLTLLLQGRTGHIYNVGSDRPITILELANLVRDTLSPGKQIRILGQADCSIGNAVRNRYVPNIDKARQELGLDVWTELQAAVRLTAACAQAGRVSATA